MARIISKKINESIEKEIYQDLLEEIKSIDSCGDLEKFFNKFMTNSEKFLIFRRLIVIKLIKQGKKISRN